MQLQDYDFNIVYRPEKDNEMQIPCLDKAGKINITF